MRTTITIAALLALAGCGPRNQSSRVQQPEDPRHRACMMAWSGGMGAPVTGGFGASMAAANAAYARCMANQPPPAPAPVVIVQQQPQHQMETISVGGRTYTCVRHGQNTTCQ